ncbi:MAG: NUDIX hydrolase [Candidatus Magasanikbacteria bacterium GW2011_GWC2_37_14]|uniref:NUDIX hydrolase n=1 Tax=Candidatus Magasanikbacteria bacterium GW2011_GWC2_37_14 TaxID=1619046 RepID=A0A0G0GAA6_9BACT|nr:MAG: NUDIX hydrolase [Candidatus Magasanikbacteria bacterium GW2011_GWC2_37_14]
MSDNKYLNIVNEAGQIIGEDSRENIHKNGLLHREVHVWFYTPQGEIILQHRGKNAETFPDLLYVTVGGHVEIGEDFEQAALKEVQEETGVKLKISDLVLVYKAHAPIDTDTVTHKINNTIRAVYVYCYRGAIKDLQTEKGVGQGFEVWPLTRILNISNEDRIKLIFSILKEPALGILKKIQTMIK